MSDLSGARTALHEAERRAGVEVRTGMDRTDLDEARRVFDVVWPSTAGSSQIQSNLLLAIVHAGGYCGTAVVDDQVVGAAFGFLGRHHTDDGAWETHLHSHMAAVLPGFRDRNIGSALKIHQRLWALEHDVPVVTWTFDPLVRRNAYVNLVKLGTRVIGYEVDFYGPMDDAINAGDPTDRMFAWWEVASELANAASVGSLTPRTPTADQIVVTIPDDIVALRERSPQEAQHWRMRVRSEMRDALDRGFIVVGVTPSGDYVLGRS